VPAEKTTACTALGSITQGCGCGSGVLAHCEQLPVLSVRPWAQAAAAEAKAQAAELRESVAALEDDLAASREAQAQREVGTDG